MLYRPPAEKNALWDTWLLEKDGIFYLFSLTRDNPKTALWDSFRLAVSTDCVHWQDKGVILRKADSVDWMGTGHTWKVGDKYILNYSECTGNLQTIKFATSSDLLQWDELGDNYISLPDSRWYQVGLENSPTATPRWDCIYVIPAENRDGYVGFLTANANFGHPSRRGVAGCVYSKDSLHFEALPPAVNPGLSAEIEVGGVAKIGSNWYMAVSLPHNLLGERNAWPDAANSGTQYLVSKNQTGPYILPTGNNRLLSAPKGWSYFGRFFSHAGKVFLNHHVIPAFAEDGISFAPLKEVREIEDGSIALFYWSGNNALKGDVLPIKLNNFIPILCGSVDPCHWTVNDNFMTASADGCAGITTINLNEQNRHGIIIDINIKFNSKTGSAGILLAPGNNNGHVLLIHQNGTAEVGTIHKNRYGWNIESLHTLPDFISPTENYHLKCLTLNSFAEFYINDRLIDVISLPFIPTEIGMIAEDCEVVFSEMVVVEMG
jgi:hypothetical protein